MSELENCIIGIVNEHIREIVTTKYLNKEVMDGQFEEVVKNSIENAIKDISSESLINKILDDLSTVNHRNLNVLQNLLDKAEIMYDNIEIHKVVEVSDDISKRMILDYIGEKITILELADNLHLDLDQTAMIFSRILKGD